MQKAVEQPRLVRSRRIPGTPLTMEQRLELEKLASMPDDQIDFSDIPEWTDEMWERAKRMDGMYRPTKQAVSLRVDADVLAWLKKDGPGYQSRINALLRERMLFELAAGK